MLKAMFICFYWVGYNTAKLRLQCKNRYPIYDQNGGKIAKIDTQFMTKTAEKPYPLGPHIPT